MSSKPTTSKKDFDPRIFPLETIITRHKSALLKRQLRNKNQTLKNISSTIQQLRSPTSTKSSPKGSPTKKSRKARSPKKVCLRSTEKCTKKVSNIKVSKSLKKHNEKEDKEYYPNKLKRKIVEKKVLLKPKHELKKIGGTGLNKRKLTVPQKGIKSPPNKRSRFSPRTAKTTYPAKSHHKLDDNHQSELCSELSAEEILNAAEAETLTDEDLLEILTCESPVWWEDPPDECYDEDAIFTGKVGKVESLLFNEHSENECTTIPAEAQFNIVDTTTKNKSPNVPTETQLTVIDTQTRTKCTNIPTEIQSTVVDTTTKTVCTSIPTETQPTMVDTITKSVCTSIPTETQSIIVDTTTKTIDTNIYTETQLTIVDTTTKIGTLVMPKLQQSKEKFLKKRLKLENLLDNIKNKLESHELTSNINKLSQHDSIKNDESTEPNLDSPIENVTTNTREITDNFPTEIETNKEIDENDKDSLNKAINPSDNRKEKRNSESSEGDDSFCSFRDDDILKDLENIDIPIEPDELKRKSTDDFMIIDELNLNSSNNNSNSFLQSDNDFHILNPEIIDKEGSEINLNQHANDDLAIISTITRTVNAVESIKEQVTNSYSITSIVKDTIESPTSSKGIFSDEANDTLSVVSSSDNLDTISDTNIRFIYGDDTCSGQHSEICSVNIIETDIKAVENGVDNLGQNKPFVLDNHDKNKSEINLNESENVISELSTDYTKQNDKEYITVYKIISNDDENQSNSDVKTDVEKTEDVIYNHNFLTFKFAKNGKDVSKKKNDTLHGSLKSFSQSCKFTYQRRPKNKSETIVKQNISTVDVSNEVNNAMTQNNSTVDVSNEVSHAKNYENNLLSELDINKTDKTIDKNDIADSEEVKSLVNEEKECNEIKCCNSCDQSAKIISHSSRVKYCLKCSSIFDTEDCFYCVRKENNFSKNIAIGKKLNKCQCKNDVEKSSE